MQQLTVILLQIKEPDRRINLFIKIVEQRRLTRTRLIYRQQMLCELIL